MNFSHNYWLLCDGSFVDSQDYAQLFNVIGYKLIYTATSTQFTNITNINITNTSSLFQLPNGYDYTFGIAGNNHYVGEIIGNETIVLKEGQYYRHMIILYLVMITKASYPFSSCPYASNEASIGGSSSDSYKVIGTFGYHSTFYSSKAGNNESINLMQPTRFLDICLFIDSH